MRLKRQLQAAMKLWVLLAKSGGRHPSQYGHVRSMFHGELPMTIREIEAWLADETAPDMNLLTIAEASDRYKVPRTTLSNRLRRRGIRPVNPDSRPACYRAVDIQHVLRRGEGAPCDSQ